MDNDNGRISRADEGVKRLGKKIELFTIVRGCTRVFSLPPFALLAASVALVLAVEQRLLSCGDVYLMHNGSQLLVVSG